MCSTTALVRSCLASGVRFSISSNGGLLMVDDEALEPAVRGEVVARVAEIVDLLMVERQKRVRPGDIAVALAEAIVWECARGG